MEGGILIGMVAVVVAAVVGGIAVARTSAAKRREALAAEAERMRFSFSPDDEEWLRKELAPFHLFSQGHNRRIANVLRGTASNLQIAVFDYRYTTGAGQHQSTHSQSVLLFESPSVEFPAFSLRPEHIFHRIGAVFGYQDIDFDEFPEFSKHYLLQAEDEPTIRRFFSQEALEHLSTHQGICIEGGGGKLIVYRSRKKVAPEVIEDFIRDGVLLYAMLSPKG